jgi:alkylation response protein AidB-like acyl-CoA dehydrogenase
LKRTVVPFDGGLWHFTGHKIVILNIGNYSVCTHATQLMFMGDEERTTNYSVDVHGI